MTKFKNHLPIEEQLTPASWECAQPVYPMGVRDRAHDTSDVSFPMHDSPVNKIDEDTL